MGGGGPAMAAPRGGGEGWGQPDWQVAGSSLGPTGACRWRHLIGKVLHLDVVCRARHISLVHSGELGAEMNHLCSRLGREHPNKRAPRISSRSLGGDLTKHLLGHRIVGPAHTTVHMQDFPPSSSSCPIAGLGQSYSLSWLTRQGTHGDGHPEL
jgi:hypothetical protein